MLLPSTFGSPFFWVIGSSRVPHNNDWIFDPARNHHHHRLPATTREMKNPLVALAQSRLDNHFRIVGGGGAFRMTMEHGLEGETSELCAVVMNATLWERIASKPSVFNLQCSSMLLVQLKQSRDCARFSFRIDWWSRSSTRIGCSMKEIHPSFFTIAPAMPLH